MNYRHIYHAGNFADVIKHITLISLINKLKAKEKPFSVLDAFAGLGIYDLSADQAERTKESNNGINLLYRNLTNDAPELIKQYIDIVKKHRRTQSSPQADEILKSNAGHESITNAISEANDTSFSIDPSLALHNTGTPDHRDALSNQNYIPGLLRLYDPRNDNILNQKKNIEQNSNTNIYPGSPVIISSLIRNNDRLIACELHKEDYPRLKQNMRLYPNSSIHNIDAYQSIKAFWPPKEKRGLVLLDPAFEVRDEFDRIIKALILLKERFTSGMVMVWYPIKDKKIVDDFYKKQSEIGYKETLFIEFEIMSDNAIGMNKCGIMICNPPFIRQQITEVMEYLTHQIYQGKAKYEIRVK